MPGLSLLSISPFPPMMSPVDVPTGISTDWLLLGSKVRRQNSCLLVFATFPEAFSLADLKQTFVSDHRPLVPLTLASLEATHTCLAQPCIIIFYLLHLCVDLNSLLCWLSFSGAQVPCAACVCPLSLYWWDGWRIQLVIYLMLKSKLISVQIILFST